MFVTRQGARKQSLCVMLHKKNEDMVMGGRSSSCMVVMMMRTRRRVKVLREEAETPAVKSRIRRRLKVLHEIGSLLSEQSLAERQLFLEKVCGSGAVMMKDFYSTITSESLQNINLEVLRFLKT